MARSRQKNRLRTASGRLSRSVAAQRAAEADAMAVALAQPHRRHLPSEARQSRLAESELGRLHLAGLISEAELDAGQRYRRLAIAYRHAIAAPGEAVSALGRLSPAAGASPPLAPDSTEAHHARLDRRYGAARAALRALPDRARVAAVLDRVALHDAPIGGDGTLLKAALSALVALWKLAPEPASMIRRAHDWHNPSIQSKYKALFDDDGS
ncbi:hypothetical protein KHC28_15620 [Ancylobacter sonchi]|uniref:hypothetical protein n=1 Tax=Ancylobacter sonchi TaxID=1937790 RepID=UPI001BD6499C|nr:hypothetical protein [Ancylobacter sonchi]MBS7535082.1 hypothetical protein [Ancylobacter sonchi]